MTSTEVHLGGCLCGGVRYRVDGPLRAIIACHCEQCRRTSGHFAAMTSSPLANVSFINSLTLKWYRSSASAERGFCDRCGSNLFWQPTGSDRVSITAGTLDTPTGVLLDQHIFVAAKSDYYQLNDGLPKKDEW
jgi:hypothetical protein